MSYFHYLNKKGDFLQNREVKFVIDLLPKVLTKYTTMLKEHINLSLRNIKRNLSFSLIKIFSLTVAFSCVIILITSAFYEWSYNKSYTDYKCIYRLSFEEFRPETVDYSINMPVPLKPTLDLEFKNELESSTRYESGNCQVLINKNPKWNGKIYFVDPDFVKIFDFKWIVGNNNTALDDPNSVVINTDVAYKVFKTYNIIGKSIIININGTEKSFTVRGVIDQVHDNSSIRNEILVNFKNYSNYNNEKDVWELRSHEVYIKLKKNIQAKKFEKDLEGFTQKYFSRLINFLKSNGSKGDKSGNVVSIKLTELSDIHFDIKNDEKAVDPSYPKVLIIISVLITAITGINFDNIVMSQSINRSKEVGIRKAIGAKDIEVFYQYLIQYLSIFVIAILLGFFISILILPLYNFYFNESININALINLSNVFYCLFFFITASFIFAAYPAFLISKYKTLDVLKNKLKFTVNKLSFKNLTLALELIITLVIIGCTSIIIRQIGFVVSAPLGYDTQQIISVPVGYEKDGYEILKSMRNTLQGNSIISTISGADLNIGSGKDETTSKSVYAFPFQEKLLKTNALNVDFDYVETLGLKVIQGRSFSKEYPSDSLNSCLINNTLAKQLNTRNVIGTVLQIEGGKTVIGVIEDYNFESLREQVKPITLFFHKPFGISYIFVKVNSNNLKNAIDLVKESYKIAAPNSAFLGSYLDENINNQYLKEMKTVKVMLVSCWLTIFLSVTGMFSISVLNSQIKLKEITVRKILGATNYDIVILLLSEYLKPLLLSIFLSDLIVWFLMNKWLNNFAYHVYIDWEIILLSIFSAVVIILVSISYQIYKYIKSTPIINLKSNN